MGLFRVRAASFLSGFAIASGFAWFQLQKELQESHEILREQVSLPASDEQRCTTLGVQPADGRLCDEPLQGKGVEERLSRLEALAGFTEESQH